jgi:hypothetical protein
MDIETIATSAAIGTILGLVSFIVQQTYVRRSLLADRRNERRHQAVLEALRSVTALRATIRYIPALRSLQDVVAKYGKPDGTQVQVAVAPQTETLRTALHSLHARIENRDEADQLSRFVGILFCKKDVPDRQETATTLDELRTFLLQLLD